MMLHQGITLFKCATIAEAEMLALIQAPDVLLAYQPVGPKVSRFINLIQTYPNTRFSCLVDNVETARIISRAATENSLAIEVFIDLNIGMNRTGFAIAEALPFIERVALMEGLTITGLHAYDGHVKETDMQLRQQQSDAVFSGVHALHEQLEARLNRPLKIVIGGSPTFPTHAAREHVECSPGTFVFWDWGYSRLLPDEPFGFAALVITRVISIVGAHTICTDLGYKAVSAESPLPRVHFLNAPDAVPVGHSEEHLVISVPDSSRYQPGDVLYGVPIHVCPTVSLYDVANVVEGGRLTTKWDVIARKRKVNY
jgi:D-serine deaminase-like pyridoxal phosphate-dependent protein